MTTAPCSLLLAPKPLDAAPTRAITRTPPTLRSQVLPLALAALSGAGLTLLMQAAGSLPSANSMATGNSLVATAHAAPAPASARATSVSRTETLSPSRAALPPPPPARRTPPPSSGTLDGGAGVSPTSTGINIRKVETAPDGPSPALLAAWEALRTGNIQAAAAGYETVHRNDPLNTDALHGLAAIALRRGQAEEAHHHFRRILDLSPQDAQARAGLIALNMQTGSPEAPETALKLVLATSPKSPDAHFSLGNLYAREGRWPEAEQAYFDALALAPDNPDYRFNLAVSLDQLGQEAAAARHYRGALELAGQHPAGFDSAQVEARLRELEH